MGGSKIPEITEQFIINTYWALKKRLGSKPTAQQLLDGVQAEIEATGRKDIYPPKLRKYGYIIKETEGRFLGLPPEQQIQQEPWNMVSLEKYPLPSDSLPHVLQVWRYCQHTNESFNIRQAKWVSRIFRVLPQMLSLLWQVSYFYAKKEELSLASGIDCDTFMDDISLVMHGKNEIQTLLELHYNTRELLDIYSLSYPINKELMLIEEMAHPIDYFNFLTTHANVNDRDRKLYTLLRDIPSMFDLKLENSIFVNYLSWITYIKNTASWAKLKPEQCVTIISKLREWSTNQKDIVVVGTRPPPYEVDMTENGELLTYSDDLIRPNEALNLLSEYAEDGGK